MDGKVLLEDFEKAADDKTVAVVVSHVEYANGFRNDLKALGEIAHQHGAVLIVDVTQSAGVIPIDVKRDNVDFLTTACYKWLLGQRVPHICMCEEISLKNWSRLTLGGQA